MQSVPVPTTVGGLSSAFAAACQQARNETELYERCRAVLSGMAGTESIWLSVTTPSGTGRVGPARDGFTEAEEVFRCQSGETELTVHATPEASGVIRTTLPQICFGLSVVLEIRSVLLDRQAALDDASFQLRALRQVVRLLSSVHSTADTEHLIHDFMAEVFFTWWAVLYRPRDGGYEVVRSRTLAEGMSFERMEARRLDRALPPGAQVTAPAEVGVGAMVTPGTELVVPMDAGGERMGLMLLGPRINARPYGQPELELAGTLALAAAIALKNSELVERLHSAATTDGLTGLFNRRATEERLEAEISRSTRHQVRTSIALIDIDRFKLINDTLGHAAGDRYLVLVAELLQHHIRSLDVAGRLGGDEFLVILPMTSAKEAKVFIDRLRQGLEQFAAEHAEFGEATISVGLAEAPRDGDSVASLLAAADAALYAAKGAGRNLVRAAGEV